MAEERRAAYQFISSATLEAQQRAAEAKAWADAQRAEIARQWADLHLQDAQTTLGPLMEQGAPEPPAMSGFGFETPEFPNVQASQGVQGGPFLDQIAPATPADLPPPPAEDLPGFGAPGANTYSTEIPPPTPALPPGAGASVGGSFADEQAAPPRVDDVQTMAALGRLAVPALTGQYGAMGGPAQQEDIGLLGRRVGEVQEERDISSQRLREAREAGDREAFRRAFAESPMIDIAMGISGPAPEAVGGVGRAAAGEVARLRLDKFPEGVRDTIEAAAEQGDFWRAQRRNVISDAEAEGMADELGRTVEEMVAGGRAGRAYNTEETRALRNGIVGQTLVVDDLRSTVDALGDTASDALRRRLGEEESRLLALSRVAEGARAEAGRAFRAYLADTRGRLLRSRQPTFTSISRVPTTPIAEMGPGPSTVPGVTEQVPLPMTLPGETAPSIYQQASLVRIAGMLAGVPTHLVNITGNAVLGGLTLGLKPAYVGADIARVGVGRALGMNPQRQRYMAEVVPQLRGYARGLGVGLEQIPEIIARGPAEQLGRVQGRKLASGSATVDTAVEMPLRALAASDALFRNASFGGHTAALATRQAIQEGLTGTARATRVEEILGDLSAHPGLQASANKLAARDVLQEQRAITDLIGQARGKIPGGDLAGDLILPFYRTPINIAAQGAGMSPTGYLAALKDATLGLRRQAAQGKVARGEKLDAFDRTALASSPTVSADAADQAVRATVGTGVLMLGTYLAANGLLTGAYPEDATERSTLPEGWKPWSFRVPTPNGTIYVPIAATGTLAVPLGTAAVMQDGLRRGVDPDDQMKTATRVLGGMGSMMLNMSALQDLSTLTQVVTHPERSAERLLENLASSAVPFSGLARTVNQAFGDAARDPRNPLEAFLAVVPGLTGLVPERQTPLGATRERGPAGPLALVIGSRVGVEVPNTVTATLRTAGVGIPDPPKAITEGDLKDIPLTEGEQREYRRIAGELLSQAVQDLLAHPDWAGATPEERAAELKATVDDVRQETRAQILERMGEEEATRRVGRRPVRARPAA